MIFIFDGAIDPGFIELDDIVSSWIVNTHDSGKAAWLIKYRIRSENGKWKEFPTPESRDACYQKLVEAKNNYHPTKEKKNMLSDIRKYISDNRDAIYTIAFVAVLDQLLFEGAFRERLKTMVEGFLKKAENKAA